MANVCLLIMAVLHFQCYFDTIGAREFSSKELQGTTFDIRTLTIHNGHGVKLMVLYLTTLTLNII